MSVSPQTNAVFTDLKKDLPKGVHVIAHQLSYPAPSVSTLETGLSFKAVTSDWNQLMHVNLPKYVAKEQQGEAELAGYLTHIFYECYPTEQEPLVVLAGYSQGAMVVHNILNEAVEYPDNGWSQLIAGAVLIADPERMPNSDTENFGTAPDSDYGLCHTLDEFIIPHTTTDASCVAPNTTTDVSNDLSSEVYQICDKGDLACDTNGLFKLNSHAIPAATNLSKLKQDAKNGANIHTTHYKSTGGAAAAVARLLADDVVLSTTPTF